MDWNKIYTRKWKLAACQLAAEYPTVWRLFGHLAIQKALKLSKRYGYTGDNEYETLDRALFCLPIKRR